MVQVIRRFVMMLTLLVGIQAFGNVTFKFKANSIADGPLKHNMEGQVSALLTAINAAAPAGKISFTGLNIEDAARTRLAALYETVPFSVDKALNISACLNDMQGYQIRGINITMKPKDTTYDGALNRQLTISLNRQGMITGVRLALENTEEADMIMSSGAAVTDLRERREILKFVEDFRCFYNEKNLDALRMIFSDDAVIITGSVMRQRKMSDGVQVGQVRYTVQNKDQYMENLRRCFARNSWINVGFDQISVAKHGSKSNIFGVTLHQAWRSTTYNDNGWLFLLWDFTDPDAPTILVRTWQEDKVAAAEGVFNHNDFFFP